MKKNHATVWVPPRTVGERAFAGEALLWTARMRAAGKETSIERNSLDSLAGLKSVNLVFDARDVSLLSANLPPLPPAKLLRALPNIVEEQILLDVNSCAFAVGGSSRDTEKLIAVIDKAWLEFVLGAFERRGLWVTAAWPAQLTLPIDAEGWGLMCINEGLALRTSAVSGLGWVAAADAAGRAEAIEAALLTADNGQKLQRPLTACCEDPSWEAPLEQVATKLGLDVTVTNLQATRTCVVNLLDGRPSSAGQRWVGSIDWRAWRLPLSLAAGCLAAFLIGLNLHWAQMVRERNALKVGLERKFQQTFPNTPVIVDPMLQMQRQVSTLRTRSGQSAPEDFGPLLAKLPAALNGRNDAVAGVEYREGRLRMRFSPTFVESRASRDGLIDAFRRQGLLLKFDAEGQATASVSLVS